MLDAAENTSPSILTKQTHGWLRWLGQWLIRLLLTVMIAWTSLALFYSQVPVRGVRFLLALACGAFGVWAIWFAHRLRAQAFLVCLFLVVFLCYLAKSPSHDRDWRPDVAKLPQAFVNGDVVTFTGVRNFEYESRDDFSARYEERVVNISDLTGIDLIVSYWRPGPVAHTFVSFHFADAPPICISIETRPERNEGFAPVASLFRQFELIYVVGDERDLIGVRALHRGEDVYLYPIQASPDAVERLFRNYIERINQLAAKPEWYHLLSNNCSLNIVRYANAAGRNGGFDVRHLLNGYIDRYLYQNGWVRTRLPFEEFRRRSRINDAIQKAVDDDDFSQQIRRSLPDRDS